MNILELLHEHVFGTLEEKDRALVEHALAESAELRAELRELEAAAAAITRGRPLLVPPIAARDRLLDAIENEERYTPFLDRLSELVDLSLAQVRTLLASLGDDASWGRGPCPGVRLIHFDPGPRAQAADAGFVKVPVGVTFPAHRHHGIERALVLEGSYLELESGLVVRTGELASRPAGSSHSFRALEGPDLVFAVVLEAPIEIDGQMYSR